MKKTTLAFVAISLAALLPLGCAAETEDSENIAAATQALHGDDLPVGSYYKLRIVGVPADQKADAANDGSTLFVKLAGGTKVMLAPGPFKVTDADGTDGVAGLQMPGGNTGTGWGGGGFYGHAPSGNWGGPFYGYGRGWGYSPYLNNWGGNSPQNFPGSGFGGSGFPGAGFPGSQPASLSTSPYACYAVLRDTQPGGGQVQDCDMTVDAIDGTALCRLPALTTYGGNNASAQDVSQGLLQVLALLNAAGATKAVPIFDKSFKDTVWSADAQGRPSAEIRCYDRQ
jgi:hypothetical protein